MSAPRSIAVVSPRYAAGATVGGAETLLRELAKRLVRLGHRVTFLTTCARDHFTWANEWPEGPWRDGELDVIRFPVAPRDAGEYLSLQRRIDRRQPLTRAEEERWIQQSVNSTALLDHLRATPYDRILAGPYLFGVVYHVARAFPDRTLLVPCLHDEPFAELGIMAEMFRGARGHLFNSEPERELARRLYGLDPARLRVVGMGLDPFTADPAAFAQRRGFDAPYVIYSGRREESKGTPLLTEYVRTFRRRSGRDLRLVFTGSGAVDGDPWILDAGFVSETEKHEAMAGAVAFIHPSVLESFGIVLLEAFLAGTPALVHARGEVLRWQCARSGGGFWFRHYPDFEEELTLLLDQPGLRRRLGEQGRAFTLAEYAWPSVERRLLEGLETL